MTDVTPGDPRERRADAAALIAARKDAELIVDNVRAKLMRYLDLEVLATQQDDHTKSLSERVTHLESELGSLRLVLTGYHGLSERMVRMEGEGFRRRLRRWWRGSYP